MASDQPNDTATAGQNQTNSTNGTPNDLIQKKSSSSPWDEELPEETPKEQKIGGFSNSAMTPNIPVKEEPSFIVPSNVENQTALNVADNSNLIRNDASPVPQAPVSVAPAPVPAPANNVLASNPTAGVSDINTSPSIVSNPADDLDIFDNNYSNQRTISADIKPSASAESPIAPTPMIPPAPVSLASPATPLVPASPAVSEPVVPANNPVVQPMVAQPMSASVVPVKKNFLTSIFKRKSVGVANTQIQAPVQNVLPTVLPNVPDQMFGQPPTKKRLPMPLLIIGGALSLIALLVFLTESGIASIGFEKIYNSLGLETFWGGLPNSGEKALGQTLSKMKDTTGFTVTGDVSINVDKTIESPISTPLVSFVETAKTAYVRPEKSILAVTTTEEWVVVDPNTDIPVDNTGSSTTTDTSTSTSTDLSGNAGDTTTPTDSSATYDTTTDSTIPSDTTVTDTTSTDQQLDSSYENVQSSTKEMSAKIEGSLGQKGNNLVLEIDKAGTAEVDLKNSLGKLWVKSDKIKFSDSAEDGKWLEYNLAGFEDKDVFKEFWSGDWGQSSVEGKKIGNEKIGKTRCYKYQIDSIEIGDALSGVGITSDMVQAISGNIWIGIKDKMIRKIDLKITPATSSSVTSINLSLALENFGNEEELTKPEALYTVTDPAPFSALTDTAATGSDTTAGTTTDSSGTTSATASTATAEATAAALVAQNDAQRKTDLLSIKNALESYKVAHGRYPLSTLSINLSTASNVLATALVPNYLSVLPSEPKSLDGWYYGYKSLDGKSYYVSSRLENALDPGLKLIDNISLYFLYNN